MPVTTLKCRPEGRDVRIPGKGLVLSFPKVVLFLALLLGISKGFAQTKDSSGRIQVNIMNARGIEGVKTDSGEYQKVLGDVILRQGTDTLYCDSAYINQGTKNFEAFSNVRIAQQGGTKGSSDYLKYTSAAKLAYMRGNVALTDGKNTLECEDLTYDLGTKVATYDNWGKLKSDSTIVTSKSAVYNVNEKNARFKGTVYIIDSQYKIRSEDLLYNTESKVTQFFSPSTVIRTDGSGILKTSNGTYDGRNGKAYFIDHSSIWNEGQYIEADTLDYNRETGHGLALGHVISLDTEHHSTMYCGYAEYWQKQKRTLATKKPVLEQVNSKDTLYMRADTFYSAPMSKSMMKSMHITLPADSMTNPEPLRDTTAKKPVKQQEQTSAEKKPAETEKNKKRKKGKKEPVIKQPAIAVDTTTADTTAPLYFIGYHHVLIFSDSLQGKCDSVCYTRSDSMIRMMYNPIAWSHNSQITGDTILMQLDSSHIRRMYVPNNAFMISQSGPSKARLFDQVQGKTLTAYFVNNAVTRMVVYPNAECIYYPKDEKGYYLGVNEANSIRMRIMFEDNKITNIKFEQDVHTKMTPIEKADIPNMRLGRYKWLIDERPKSKEELFK